MKTWNWFVTVVLFLALTSAIREVYNSLNTGDASFRQAFDEVSINQFAFFWTNFWYLPVFFFTLSYVIIKRLVQAYLSIFFYILYTYEVLDLGASSWQPKCLTNFQYNLNTFLTNNINKYHPFIFYVSVLLVFYLFYALLFSLLQNKLLWANSCNLQTFSTTLLVAAASNFLALFLGSWWALQEGTWGGWWNWDASETFGLFWGVFMLRCVHLTTVVQLSKKLYSAFLNLIYFTLILYCLTQLNFELISHNFGIKFFFFFNNSLFFLENLFLGFFLITWSTYQQIIFSTHLVLICFKTRLKANTKFTVFLAFSFIFYIWLCLASFGPIFSYFIWSFFNISIFNELGLHFIRKLSTALIVFTTFLFNVFAPSISFLVLLTLWYSHPFYLIILVARNSTFIRFLHKFFIIFLILNLEKEPFLLAHNFLSSCFFVVSDVNYTYYAHFQNFILDGPHIFTTIQTYPDLSWSFLHQNFLLFTTLLPIFNFFINSVICTSFLFSESESFCFITGIELSTVINNAILLNIWALLWLIYWLLKKQRNLR